MPNEATSLTNGLHVSEKEVLALLAKMLEEKNAELVQWRERVERLERENRTLQEKFRKSEELQEMYAKSVLALLPPCEMTFTAEEIADLEKNGQGIEDILSELDALSEQKR